MNRGRELLEEFGSVFSGRGIRLLDSFLPLLVFLMANVLAEVNAALWSAIVVAGFFAAYRVFRKESLVYALGAVGATVLASIFVKLSGSEAGFFLPGFISGAVTILLCVVSVALNRPMVAWTSFITRRWPLNWYWHPRVLPAYNEVTILWGIAFAARLAVEFQLYRSDELNTLGAVRIFLGWPFLIALLIVSYLYGLWRLGQLKGPSVHEFKAGQAPPWSGQKRGF